MVFVFPDPSNKAAFEKHERRGPTASGKMVLKRKLLARALARPGPLETSPRMLEARDSVAGAALQTLEPVQKQSRMSRTARKPRYLEQEW